MCEEACEAEAVTTERETIETQDRAAGSLTPVEIAPQASEPWLLPSRLIVPAPRGSLLVTRGVLGYRIPLVVKQEVPGRIRGGVYIPAHETYVVLRPGYWEMATPPAGLAETEPEAAVVETSGDAEKPQPRRRGWLWRLFNR